MSQKSIGRIINYRIGIRTQNSKECLIEFKNIDLASTGKLVGQKVVWTNDKKTFNGKIVGTHGNKGLVRAKFSRPVPGQAIGTTIKLKN